MIYKIFLYEKKNYFLRTCKCYNKFKLFHESILNKDRYVSILKSIYDEIQVPLFQTRAFKNHIVFEILDEFEEKLPAYKPLKVKKPKKFPANEENFDYFMNEINFDYY